MVYFPPFLLIFLFSSLLLKIGDGGIKSLSLALSNHPGIGLIFVIYVFVKT